MPEILGKDRIPFNDVCGNCHNLKILGQVKSFNYTH